MILTYLGSRYDVCSIFLGVFKMVDSYVRRQNKQSKPCWTESLELVKSISIAIEYQIIIMSRFVVVVFCFFSSVTNVQSRNPSKNDLHDLT